jgi:peptide/nickel transport system ATP-binding protein
MAILEATGVQVEYRPQRGQVIKAVRDVDLVLEQGEFVGLVGESGCGKSTLGFALTRMLAPPAVLAAGQIDIAGVDVSTLTGEALRTARKHGFALVLQSGMNALNPVRTISHAFRDVLRAHADDGHKVSTAEADRVSTELLGQVGLPASVLRQFPHELSGGMRQRVAIALALALEPHLVVFDEPTTALDVMVQQQVMQTIKTLQQENHFTALLISHDLGVVLEATGRLIVMYAGRIVEDQPSDQVLVGAHHPYTEALLSCYADPRAEEVELGGIPGAPPDLSQTPAGCPFAPRCPLVEDVCRTVDPPLLPFGAGKVACHVRTREGGAHVGVSAASAANGVRAKEAGHDH